VFQLIGIAPLILFRDPLDSMGEAMFRRNCGATRARRRSFTSSINLLRYLVRTLAVLALAVPALLFVTSPAQAFPGDTSVVYIREFAGNNKCLDVTAAGTADGTLLQRWDCGPQWNQQFAFSEPGYQTGQLSWKIRPRYLPSKCLDAKDGLNATTPVQIWDCHIGWQQRWVIENLPGSTKYYWLHAAYNLNYCLQIPGTQNGAVAYIRPCDGTFGQAFSG
jgi:hypothetical protein